MAKEKVSFTDHPWKQHAFLSLALAGQEWRGDPEKLLLECIAALGVYGTSKQLKRKFNAVREAAFINRDLPMDREDREKIAASLNELGGLILRYIAGVERIEQQVEKLGCRVNPETGRVSFKRGGRGPDVVRKRIWTIYTEKYREEGNTVSVRRKIKKELSSWIDENELNTDADSGALIYDAIEKGKRRSK